jgi:uncharacterized damage-inducible protein DinB
LFIIKNKPIMNTLIRYFQNQLEKEAPVTRKMLERVPEDRLGWQPHPKSMSLGQLATHVAEIPNWVPMVAGQDVLEFSPGDYHPFVAGSRKELLDYFEKNLGEGRATLEKLSDDVLDKTWTMRSGQQVMVSDRKDEVLRMCLSQIIHHRAQLGVYLRLLDIPIPGSYGPSADEM